MSETTPPPLQPVLAPPDVQLGLDTFGDVTVDTSGAPRTQAQVLREVVEQGVLADEVGVAALGLGEHHRDDFAISSPEMVLSAIASRTSHVSLGSAVTVLSSDDPGALVNVAGVGVLAATDNHDAAMAAVEHLLSPEVQQRLVQRMTSPHTALSPRESEILEALATGATNREVAKRLFISESTVKTHLVHLYDKLGVDSRTAALRVARERRLIR